MVVVSAGVVEKENEDPPFNVTSEVAAVVAMMTKSLITPVVAPVESETAIVHTIGSPTREGEVLVQVRVVADVGVPYTTKDNDPLFSKTLPNDDFTLME
jgi:hypothetical protein